MPAQSTLDAAKAIEFAQLVNATYATQPSDLTNAAGQTVSAGGMNYDVVTTIYANDLATDMSPGRADDEVSIGSMCQESQTGDVMIAIRGTEGILGSGFTTPSFRRCLAHSWSAPATPKTASPPCTSP